MKKIERKVFDKRNPADEERGKFFIPFPSDARHYIYHPKMKPEYLYLYTLIIDYYNEAEGRAFPSLITLEMVRSEERRVGKECRSRCSAKPYKTMETDTERRTTNVCST